MYARKQTGRRSRRGFFSVVGGSEIGAWVQAWMRIARLVVYGSGDLRWGTACESVCTHARYRTRNAAIYAPHKAPKSVIDDI